MQSSRCAEDGSSKVVPYTPGTRPGDYQPTPPDFTPAFRPGLGKVATFGIKNGAQFRLDPPPALHSDKYAPDYNEVKRVGDANSSERPRDRTDGARFYAVTDTVLYNPAARQVSEAQGKTLSENARIFALLTMAIFDAAVAVFDSKYFYDFWRPVTAIRAGDSDGNDKTAPEHYSFDQESAAHQGRRVASYILRHQLRPVRAPSGEQAISPEE
jgi:hypothetical protein